MSSRVLPHSLEAEMAILGALLIYPRTVAFVRESNLRVGDFYSPQNQSLFTAMLELMEQNQPIDLTTITTKLMDAQSIGKVGGANYLIELTQNSTTPENVKYYIDSIQKKAQLRNLIEVTQKIQDEGFDSTKASEDILQSAEREILQVTRMRNATDMRSGEEVIVEVLKQIRLLSQRKNHITGLETKFSELDKVTNGLQKGDLIILAARPSAGKTAFALNLALNVAQYNPATVAIFSLEMPGEHLIQRMIASRSKIAISKLRAGEIRSEREWNALEEAAKDIQSTKLFIDDGGSITVPVIASKCRKLATEEGLHLIVIDYIQLIAGSSRTDNRQQEVSEISRGLKQLARELGVPIIALSQLSRSVEQRANSKPMLSDLRESGSIEQDADIVMFLSRDDYQKTNEDEENQSAMVNRESMVDLYMAKHRNGATGHLDFSFDKEINAFYTIKREGDFNG